MSFIHQRLYLDGSMQTVNIAIYVRELVAYLRSALDTATCAQFDSRVPDMELDVAQAVPIGLILNEAVTNAMKYAFPGRDDGLITITLKPGEDGSHLLSIKDNGVGLPPGSDPGKSKTLGFTLIQTMAEQIGASFTVRSEGGLELLFSFTIRALTAEDEPYTTEESYA
jgi:two-component sensor histidine kinase